MCRCRASSVVALTGALLLLSGGASAQGTGPLEARVWLDRGAEPTLLRGESARLYYRASSDAYLAIFQIDTNGSARMLFPRTPAESHFVRGGVDYRLLFARSSSWQVDEDPGVGYFFVIASPRSFDFSHLRYSPLDRGWDVSGVAREVYRDPFVAMDQYVAALIPDWQAAPHALDFAAYHVGGPHPFPRFLCYECHGFRSYSAWNPYAYDCSVVRLTVVDDPYYSVAERYRADRVVFARRTTPFEPRFDFKERTAGEPGTPLLLASPWRAAGSQGGSAPSGARGRSVGADADGVPAGRSGGLGAQPLRPASSDGVNRPRPVLQPRPSEPGGSPSSGGPPPPPRAEERPPPR